MTNNEIIEKICKQKLVPHLISNITKTQNESLKDLEQDIYLSLLEMDNEKLNGIYERNQLTFWIVRMLQNQIHSVNSPYYTKYRKFLLLSDNPMPDNDNDVINDDEWN